MENNVEIWNAKITNVSLSMEDHGCLIWGLTLDGGGKGCVYGGWVIGTGYLGAEEFKGSEDKWFDAKVFFETKEKERPAKHIPKNVDELRQFIISKLREEYDEIYDRKTDTDIIVQVEEENNGRNDVWIQFPYFHSK